VLLDTCFSDISLCRSFTAHVGLCPEAFLHQLPHDARFAPARAVPTGLNHTRGFASSPTASWVPGYTMEIAEDYQTLPDLRAGYPRSASEGHLTRPVMNDPRHQLPCQQGSAALRAYEAHQPSSSSR